MREKTLDELTNIKYKDQDVSLSSKQIDMMLTVFRNNVNTLRNKGMGKMADHRESILRSIINELK